MAKHDQYPERPKPIILQAGGKCIHYRTDGVFLVRAGQPDFMVCGQICLEKYRAYEGGGLEVVLAFQDVTGKKRTLAVKRSMFGKRQALIDVVVDAGLHIADDRYAYAAIHEYYKQAPPTKRVHVVSRPGWHYVASVPVAYVSSTGVISTDDSGEQLELTPSITSGHGVSEQLNDWNRQIGDFCIGNPYLQFGVCFALASSIIRFSGLSNFGALIFGAAKSGKTVLLRVAASVYGDPSYALTWNSTSNALEIIAICRNDGFLPLDEIGQGDPKAVYESVYDLMNGRSKSRLNSSSSLEVGSPFSVLVLASGEHDLRTHLSLSKLQVKDGQLARLFSIPVPNGGVIDKLHNRKCSAELCAELINKTAQCYGSLGKAFIEFALQNEKALIKKLPRRIREEADKLLGLIENVPNRQLYEHVAKGFALVRLSGEIAIKANLLTWPKGAVGQAVEHCFKAWASEEARFSLSSDDAAFQKIQLFFQSDRAQKFLPLESFEQTGGSRLAGYRHVIDGRRVFLVYPAFFEEQLCSKFGKTTGIRVLDQHGLLVRGHRGTPMRQANIPKGLRNNGPAKVSFYVVSEDILRYEPHAARAANVMRS